MENKILNEMKEYFANTSKEQLKKDFEELAEYNQFGPKARDFVNNICQSFSITYEERQSLWDREFKKYMEYPKEELVKMLIGRRP